MCKLSKRELIIGAVGFVVGAMTTLIAVSSCEESTYFEEFEFEDEPTCVSEFGDEEDSLSTEDSSVSK